MRHTGNAPMPAPRQRYRVASPAALRLFQPDTPVGHTGDITIHNNQRWKGLQRSSSYPAAMAGVQQ